MLRVCGCRPVVFDAPDYPWQPRNYLPLVSLSSHTVIVSTTSKTVLEQRFVSDSKEAIPECQYDFPLYDGVSVVGFTCQVGSRIINGVVKEKATAKQVYQDAIDKGETAGLLAQGPTADVFSTKVGNVPAGESILITVTYIGELIHDVGAESIRFTIPTSIAPRYSNHPPPSQVRNVSANNVPGIPTARGDAISITVDINMAEGSFIREVRSPSHPIAVTMGNTTSSVKSEDPKPSQASASLSQGNTELDWDFVLEIINKDSLSPKAVLEAHPSNPQDRALMVTLVPPLKLPSAKPEIILVADRSGSMLDKIPALINALKIFLRSLPVGIDFNVCSFGSSHTFLWEKSHVYNEQSFADAMSHVEAFSADYGGTETLAALQASLGTRDVQQDLALILCTDGDIWQQQELFVYLNQQLQESKKPIHVFPLGIGDSVSSALIEGVARAGKGFASTVGRHEKMDAKVVHILKAALVENVTDYTLEVRYKPDEKDDDDFVLVERVVDSLEVLSLDDLELGQIEADRTAEGGREGFKSTTQPALSHDLHGQAGLPTVAVPKLLQSPQEIPPLYFSSRATTYLLMSPDAFHMKPTSVILRGTSSQGPLEYHIPVEILAEPGETIHQLAARSAVGELEEGRGWLTVAKDKDGTLLKQKYTNPTESTLFGTKRQAKDSQFQKMVEREAVRLGVQYQVGGKWCSFVAVEGNKESSQEGNTRFSTSDRDYDEGLLQLGGRGSANMRTSTPGRGNLFGGVANSASFYGELPAYFQMARSSSVFAHGASTFSLANSSPPLDSEAAYPSYQCRAPPPPSSFEAYGSAASEGAKRCRGRAPSAASDEDSDQSFQSASGPRGTFGGSASLKHGAPPPAAQQFSAPKYRRVSQYSQHQQSSSPPTAASNAEDPRPLDPLAQIMALQRFQGNWEFDQALLNACGLANNSKAHALLIESPQTSTWKSIWGTILVVVYMERNMVAEKDVWELVVDKAKVFLQQRGVNMKEEMGKSPLKELLMDI